MDSKSDPSSSGSSSTLTTMAMAQEQAEVIRNSSYIPLELDTWQQSPSIPIRSKQPPAQRQVDDRPPIVRETSSTTPGSSSSIDRPPIKLAAFTKRDASAISYTKSLLDEGDTLVIVRFPNNIPVYDTTGFQLSDTHRVNSHKLKAASPLFKKSLEDDWQQHRMKRRNKLLGCLPPGIVYVLDLTPPDEGDAALELTAELSCSLGIRRWYKSEFSGIAAAHGLVGGQDETTVHPDYLKKEAVAEEDHNIASADTHMPNDSIVGQGFADGDSDTVLEARLQEQDRRHPPDPNNQQSGQNQQESEYTKSHVTTEKEIETLDYCPIRHRTGIERLLQIIEGKDPRLDSAPKVWTLAVLAAHFECANSVVDYVITWMIAEPNCKIFEVLPEDCLRIGLMLENEVATGYAFTILVSEEALRVGTARSDPSNRPNTNPTPGKQVTKYGRPRESLDEDTLNLIQHAGRDFHAKIEGQITNLMNPNMNWLHSLPEFVKILKIKDFMESHNVSFKVPRLRSINDLISELIDYVRGRLLWCFYQPLDSAERLSWKEHRAQEQHSRGQGVSISDTVHNELGEHEKILTRSFWSLLRMLKWIVGDARCSTNLIRDEVLPQIAANKELDARVMAAADATGIKTVFLRGVESSADAVNKIILSAIRDTDFNEGKFPNECFIVEKLVGQDNDENAVISESSGGSYDDYAYQRAQKSGHWSLRSENIFLDDSTSSTPLPFPLLEVPYPTSYPTQANHSSISDERKLDFWKEALLARDEAIAREDTGAEYSPEIEAEDIMEIPESWQDEFLIPDKSAWQPESSSSSSSYAKIKEGYSPSWAKLQDIWNEEQEQKIQTTIPVGTGAFPCAPAELSWVRTVAPETPSSDQLRDGRDSIPNRAVSWSLHPSAGQSPIVARTFATFESTSTPHVPRDRDIYRSSPFFSLARLFEQIDSHLSVVSTRMLSRGSIQDLRPPSCDVCDTLLCLSDEEYKYLPLWAGGLNDGSGGVFEDPIPPAERGGAMGPGPAYRTGSTAANSSASTDSGLGFESGSERWGSETDDSIMGGVNTSIGVEDGFSVSHVDRRRVFSEADFPTPNTSEFGDESVVYVGNEDEDIEMDLPIRNKGKERAVDYEEDDFKETSYASEISEEKHKFTTSIYAGKRIGTGKQRAVDGEEDEEGEEGEWSNTKRVMIASLNGFGVDKEEEQRLLMDMYSGGEGKDKENGKKSGGGRGEIEDDDTFFNTAGDYEEFDFESESEGEATETEDDFEYVV